MENLAGDVQQILEAIAALPARALALEVLVLDSFTDGNQARVTSAIKHRGLMCCSGRFQPIAASMVERLRDPREVAAPGGEPDLGIGVAATLWRNHIPFVFGNDQALTIYVPSALAARVAALLRRDTALRACVTYDRW